MPAKRFEAASVPALDAARTGQRAHITHGLLRLKNGVMGGTGNVRLSDLTLTGPRVSTERVQLVLGGRSANTARFAERLVIVQ
jgi:hypothetical protein